jgi:hypothetical protein
VVSVAIPLALIASTGVESTGRVRHGRLAECGGG